MRILLEIFLLTGMAVTALCGAVPQKIPAIIYSLEPVSDDSFKNARKLGFNTAHTYGGGHDKPDRIEKDILFLDLAEKNGMKVMFHLNGGVWTKKTDKNEQFRKYIRHFKNHPALSIWYLYDEPGIKEIPALRQLYQILKDETPEIPVAIAMNWTEDFMRYGDVYDIILPDVYPVVDQPFPAAQVDQLMVFTAELQKLGKPVIPIAQALNWKAFPEEAERRARNPLNCRYPNMAEIRYWLYVSAIQGCDGIAFYSYYRSIFKDKAVAKPWSEKILGPALREYMKWRGDGFIFRQELKRLKDTHFRGMVGITSQGEFLVLVNEWPLEQYVDRWMEGLVGEATLEPVCSTRSVKAEISNGRIKVKEPLQPWETMVWGIKRKLKE